MFAAQAVRQARLFGSKDATLEEMSERLSGGSRVNAARRRAPALRLARPRGRRRAGRAHVRGDTVTPVALLDRMRRVGPECFLLESVEGGETTGRYTFLGCDPMARFEIAADAASRSGCPRGPTAIRSRARAIRRPPGFVPDPELPPLSGGAVGLLGYDAVRLFEAIPDRHPREGKIPDGLFLLFDAVVAFDHRATAAAPR